jgi:hypothetical protein
MHAGNGFSLVGPLLLRSTQCRRAAAEFSIEKRFGMNPRSLTVRLAIASVVGACVLSFSSPAFAGGKGGGSKTGGSGSSLSLVLLNSTDGLPHWGQQVTFNVSSQTKYPTVNLKCYQSGALVYSASAGFYASYPWPWAQDMTLQSGAWTGGDADCTATLSGNTVLATLNFHVYA